MAANRGDVHIAGDSEVSAPLIILDEAHFERLARDGYIAPSYFEDSAKGHFAHYRSGGELMTTQLDVPLCAHCESPVNAFGHCAPCDEDYSLVPVERLSEGRIAA